MYAITKIARHLNRKVAVVLASILLVLAANLLPLTVAAACNNDTTGVTQQEASQETPSGNPSCCGQDKDGYSFDSTCDLIGLYVNPAIDVFSGIFGLIAVISIILGGIQYSASEGDPQKASQAKDRITKTIFAIMAYFFLFAFLQFIIPGGAFNRTG